MTAMKNRCDLSTSVRTFMWKLKHNTHKCGQYWLKIKNLEDRGLCQTCNTIESMQHIIFNCEANNCTYAWDIVKEICTLKNIPWPQGFDITMVMALPLLKIRSTSGKTRMGTTQLFLITASECAFYLWKARCKRLLDDSESTQGRTPPPQETRNCMIAILNERLELDHTLTSWKRYQNKALPGRLILRTWSGTLQNEHSLPEDWLRANGVLVGIAKGPHTGSIAQNRSGIG